MSFDLSNYVDVKTRIKLFFEKYPEGSLQFEFKGEKFTDAKDPNKNIIWGIAYAYRNPEDPRPSTGHASELAEGKTAYTRGSELMNLETSAIGRAIGNLGIGIEAGMATSDEVQFAKERQREIPREKPSGSVLPVEPYEYGMGEKDPWAADVASPVEQALTDMGATPWCACNQEMKYRDFKRKSDGKQMTGFFCVNDKCSVLWTN